MELALSLEKLNFIKLRELHRVAANAEDAQLADFIGELASADMHALCLLDAVSVAHKAWDRSMSMGQCCRMEGRL